MLLTYRWRATLVIGLGLLMSILDITIVGVVLRQIATALHDAKKARDTLWNQIEQVEQAFRR